MKKMKFAAIVAAVLMCFASLAGCLNAPKGETGNDYEVDTELDKQITETLKISINVGDSEGWIMDKLIEGFNQEYPNVTIVKDPISGGLIDTMMGYWKGNTMPDLFGLNNYEMLNLAKAGLICNLKPYIDAETAAGKFDANDYDQPFWKLGQENFDGDQLMIPRSSDQVVTHINMKVLRDAGMDTSKIRNGWTWDDFMSVINELKAKKGGGLIDTMMNWEAVFNPLLESAGATYFDEETRTATIESEQTEFVLAKLRELYVANGEDYSGGFDSGTGAFLFHSRPAALSVKMLKEIYGAEWQDDYYDVVSMPVLKADNPKIGAGVYGYCIASTTTGVKRDIAWKFLKYVVSAEGQNKMSEAGMNFPPIRKDMQAVDSANKWVQGFERYNMAAFTYGSVNNMIAPTKFILIKPSRSNELITAVKTMVNNYVTDGYTAQKAMQKCAQSLEYWLDF